MIGTSQDIDFEGSGEMLRVAEKPARRRAHLRGRPEDRPDRRRDLQGVPTPFVIERTGDTAE